MNTNEMKFNTFAINVFSNLIQETNRVFTYDVNHVNMNLSSATKTSLIIEGSEFKVRIELTLKKDRIRLKLSQYRFGRYRWSRYYTLITANNFVLAKEAISPEVILLKKNFNFVNTCIWNMLYDYIKEAIIEHNS